MRGVILVGGSSSRMGKDKAGVVIEGRPMLEWVQTALNEAGLEVAIVGRDESAFGEASADIWLSMGPLSGLATALTEWGPCVLVAVDQPLIRAETVRNLASALEDQPVVPLADGARQVTCAAYPESWAALASEEVAAGGSIQSLLDREPYVEIQETTWRAWGEDGRSWFSVDTPEDASLAEGIVRGETEAPWARPTND